MMNYNQTYGCPPPTRPEPGIRPGYPMQRPGAPVSGPNMNGGMEHFPVGMGYVPMQNWETVFPMEIGFQKGTIFPSLDYPFVMGRCRR